MGSRGEDETEHFEQRRIYKMKISGEPKRKRKISSRKQITNQTKVARGEEETEHR